MSSPTGSSSLSGDWVCGEGGEGGKGGKGGGTSSTIAGILMFTSRFLVARPLDCLVSRTTSRWRGDAVNILNPDVSFILVALTENIRAESRSRSTAGQT